MTTRKIEITPVVPHSRPVLDYKEAECLMQILLLSGHPMAGRLLTRIVDASTDPDLYNRALTRLAQAAHLHMEDCPACSATCIPEQED